MTMYECVFDFNGGVVVIESDGGPSMFSQGFWINDALEFTQLDDCKYWIPPSAIQYIEKTEVDIVDVGEKDDKG